MSVQHIPPKPTGNSWINWAQRLGAYLQQTRSILRHKLTGESAKDNGIILWDEANGYPVVSKDNVYRQIVLANGYGSFACETDHSPAAINTAYPIVFDTTQFGDGVALGTPASRVTINEDGLYWVFFSVQITSNSSSAKNVWFWPRKNGVDVAGSTIGVTLNSNSSTIVMSRGALFPLLAGDYIEAYYAADDTDVTLDAIPATSFAPAAPAVLLSATRIRQ